MALCAALKRSMARGADRRQARVCALALASTIAGAAGGCALDGEPSLPCGSLSFDGEDARSDRPPPGAVLALSDGTTILRLLSHCEGPACADAPLRLDRVRINDAPTQLAIAGDARHVLIRTGQELSALDLDLVRASDPTNTVQNTPTRLLAAGVRDIVGSLRTGAIAIVRTHADGRLRAIDLEAEALDGLTGAPPQILPLGGPDQDLRVLAIGDRTLLARTPGARPGSDDVWLVQVRSLGTGTTDSAQLGRAQWIARGNVEFADIVRGAPPGSLGIADIEPTRPTDRFGIVTLAGAAQGGEALTLVIDIAHARVIDAFPGKVATSRNLHAEVPGLRAASPDGSHLAYVTPRGSAALRNLETQGACVVRADPMREHSLVGFARDASLILQADAQASGSVLQRLDRYDPAARTVEALGDDQGTFGLRAVPLAQAGQRSFALAVRDNLLALTEGDHRVLSVAANEMLVLPSDDARLWLLEVTVSGQTAGAPTELSVHVVEDSEGGLVIDEPRVAVDAGVAVGFHDSIGDASRLCAAASRAGGWAPACATSMDPQGYLRTGLPSTESTR